jgi:hypothetical protein
VSPIEEDGDIKSVDDTVALNNDDRVEPTTGNAAQTEGVDNQISTNGYIVFLSDRDGSQDLYIMEADGSNVSKILPNWPRSTPKNIQTFSLAADGSLVAIAFEKEPQLYWSNLQHPIPTWSEFRINNELTWPELRRTGWLHIESIYWTSESNEIAINTKFFYVDSFENGRISSFSPNWIADINTSQSSLIRVYSDSILCGFKSEVHV